MRPFSLVDNFGLFRKTTPADTVEDDEQDWLAEAGKDQGNRMMRPLVLAAVCFLAAGQVRAQVAPPTLPSPPAQVQVAGPALPPPAPCTALTLADLEHLALTSNPTIPAAQALVVQEEAWMQQAGLYPNPTGGYLRTDPDQPDQSKTAGLLQPGHRHGRQVEDRHRGGPLRGGARQLATGRPAPRVLNDVRIRFYEVLAPSKRCWSSSSWSSWPGKE